MKSDEAVELLRECVAAFDKDHRRVGTFATPRYKAFMECCRVFLAPSKAAPQENKAEAASSEADFKASDLGAGVTAPDSMSRRLPNNPASAAPASGEGMTVEEWMAFSLREKRETSLTYPPEAASWVAIKGDKPVAVVEKAAYDDLRAIHVALREQREGWIAVGSATDTGECGIPWGTRIVTKQDIDGSRYQFILPLLFAAPSTGRGEREKP